MKTYCLSFTDKGEDLGKKLEDEIGAYSYRCNEPLGLSDWTDKAFDEADNIIYIGACGIAVRAIAGHVVSKVTDPAVIVIDECGDFVISLMSGHLGGANDMAERIAKAIGATPVITTATDRNGVFAVDEWAKRQNAVVLEPEKIKLVSSSVLAGKDVLLSSEIGIAGEPPEHIVTVGGDAGSKGGATGGGSKGSAAEDADSKGSSAEDDGSKGGAALHFGVFMTDDEPLHIVPKAVHIGIGCRRGTDHVTIENAFGDFKRETKLIEQSIKDISSIDVKQDEQGIKEFAEFHAFPFMTFTAEELSDVPGDFSGSDFVKSTVGVDNVCERAAVKAAGDDGVLIVKKYSGSGVTFAAAIESLSPDWRWKDE